jgi:hypothetical protein
MRFSRMVLCIIVAVFIPATPILSVNPYQSKASTVQTWMTVGASLSSLAMRDGQLAPSAPCRRL